MTRDAIMAMFDPRRRAREETVPRELIDDGAALMAGDVFLQMEDGTMRRALPGEVPPDIAAAARAAAEADAARQVDQAVDELIAAVDDAERNLTSTRLCPFCRSTMKLLQPDPRSQTLFHPHWRCTNPKCRHVIEQLDDGWEGHHVPVDAPLSLKLAVCNLPEDDEEETP